MMRIGLKINWATILGRIKKLALFTPITSSASICSLTRIVPKLEATFEPTLPARIKLTTVGLNSSVIDSRVAMAM